MSLWAELQTEPRTVEIIETTDESYTQAIRCLARYFLDYLDTNKLPGWEPDSDSVMDLGRTLYDATKEKIPQELRDELSGGQVASAAHLAFRAWKGD